MLYYRIHMCDFQGPLWTGPRASHKCVCSLTFRAPGVRGACFVTSPVSLAYGPFGSNVDVHNCKFSGEGGSADLVGEGLGGGEILQIWGWAGGGGWGESGDVCQEDGYKMV